MWDALAAVNMYVPRYPQFSKKKGLSAMVTALGRFFGVLPKNAGSGKG